MIERGFVDLAQAGPDGRAAPPHGAGVVHLSAPDDARWSGVVELAPRAVLALDAGLRHDLFMLRGELADEHGLALRAGDFASRSTPGRLYAGAGGATLFAYRQAPGDGRERVVAQDARTWRPGRAPGLAVAPLSDDGHSLTLVDWQPGARTAPHAHARGEEIFVLGGELRSGDARLPAGSWLRLHPGEPHAPFAQTPTLILLRNGHLRPRARESSRHEAERCLSARR